MSERKLTYRFGGMKAEWWGGPYIELTFGHLRRPTEVIYVWDYETDRSRIPFRMDDLVASVHSWMAEARANDPDWYTRYLDNA